jgi:hypothetical protein
MSGYFQTPSIPVLTAKSPADVRQWQADFSNIIAAGDTIATIDSVVASPSDLTVGSTAIIAGHGGASLAVGMVLSAGTIGNTYTVTTDITDTAGNQYSRSFDLPVQAR